FTIEEGVPLAAAERERMPDADTVWLTPLDDLATSLERAGLVVTWQEDHSRAHHEMAQALAGAFAADSESIAAQIGRRALDERLPLPRRPDPDARLDSASHGGVADAERAQRMGGEAVLFGEQAQQHVLGAQAVVAQRARLVLAGDHRAAHEIGGMWRPAAVCL